MRAVEVLQRYVDLPEFSGLTLTDVNQRGNYGNTPLHVASTRGNLEEVDALLAGGSNLDSKGQDGITPLYRAAEQGHVAVVKRLLQAGASPDVADDDGCTPRQVAHLLNHHEVVDAMDEWCKGQAKS